VQRIGIRHGVPDGMGGLTFGSGSFVDAGQFNAAIPSVAVNQDGVVGVFFYTCDDDGTASGGFPKFSAHFALSDDQGATFSDNVLVTFLSPAKDNGDPRQRVLGDYMQTKTVPKSSAFYGSFSGNGAAVGGPVSQIDPFYFQVGG
jgi:hypothetical protein